MTKRACACVRSLCVLMLSNVYAYLQFYDIVLISIDWTNMCAVHINVSVSVCAHFTKKKQRNEIDDK